MTTLIAKQLLNSLIIRIFVTKSFREVLHNVIPQHSGYQWLSPLQKLKQIIYIAGGTHLTLLSIALWAGLDDQEV
jgi:hypothetical protein